MCGEKMRKTIFWRVVIEIVLGKLQLTLLSHRKSNLDANYARLKAEQAEVFAASKPVGTESVSSEAPAECASQFQILTGEVTSLGKEIMECHGKIDDQLRKHRIRKKVAGRLARNTLAWHRRQFRTAASFILTQFL